MSTSRAISRERFSGDERITLVEHDLQDGLPCDGPFDAVVSSFAIHHVTDERKRTLFADVAALLSPSGVFANLDIVASPTPELHDQWRDDAGLQQVDCIRKWRSLVLMRGQRVG